MVFDGHPNIQQKLLPLRYASVPDEGADSEDESNSEKQPLPRSSPKRRIGIIIPVTVFTLIVISVAALLTFFYSSSNAGRHDTGHPKFPRPHCGNSAQEARARNCIYDVMLGGWTPPHCYSHKLETEFLTLPELKWYYDEAHTREISLEVLKQGELETVYPAPMYHDRHCLYTWRLLHEAVMGGGLVDYQSGSPEHTRHCTQLLLGVIPPKPVKSEERKFNYCVEVGIPF
jgi:hypothetical protein